MTENTTARVLVPFAVLDGETVPPGVVEFLAQAHTVLLGYHEVPDQTPPDQARLQFEERGEGLLDDVAGQFQGRAGTVERRLVFTRDSSKTIERVAAETDCDGTLLVQPTQQLDRVYVALADPTEANALGATLAGILPGLDIDVSLRYFGTDPEGETALSTVADRLSRAGVESARIDSAVAAESWSVGAVTTGIESNVGAGTVDVVVVGDSGVSLSGMVLGDAEGRIAATVLAPVLVVRQNKQETTVG